MKCNNTKRWLKSRNPDKVFGDQESYQVFLNTLRLFALKCKSEREFADKLLRITSEYERSRNHPTPCAIWLINLIKAEKGEIPLDVTQEQFARNVAAAKQKCPGLAVEFQKHYDATMKRKKGDWCAVEQKTMEKTFKQYFDKPWLGALKVRGGRLPEATGWWNKANNAARVCKGTKAGAAMDRKQKEALAAIRRVKPPKGKKEPPLDCDTEYQKVYNYGQPQDLKGKEKKEALRRLEQCVRISKMSDEEYNKRNQRRAQYGQGKLAKKKPNERDAGRIEMQMDRLRYGDPDNAPFWRRRRR
jgi:hypothetical protein